jgi:hypothetical protein
MIHEEDVFTLKGLENYYENEGEFECLVGRLPSSNNLRQKIFFKNAKLIARPLSDLTREITHNGETFVPIVEMAKMFHVNNSNTVTHYLSPRCSSDFAMVQCCVENNDNRYLYYQVFLNAWKNKYREIEYMHSLHFDTFGLIEAGLAIDINTLKK